MLMLQGPFLFLLLMFFSNEGKSEIDIPKVAIAEKNKDESYCATFDETNGKCSNYRQKRSLDATTDENTTTESAVPELGSTELNKEAVSNTEVNTDPSVSNNTSVNPLKTEVNISKVNSSDVHNSSTSTTTVITYTDINSTYSTVDMTENILSGRNDSQNYSILPNETADNLTDVQNSTQSESTDINNELIQGENYTESDPRITNSSQVNYSADINNIVDANENLVLTNMTAETHAANATSNYTSDMLTTEETLDSTTVNGNTRRKREIQNLVTDENKSNGSIIQNSTESYSVNTVEYSNVTNTNDTILKEKDSDLNFMNSTESTISEIQNIPLNSTDSDYNVTEIADSLINSTNTYINKSETNITDFEQTTNVTTNLTDNHITDMSNNTTENVTEIEMTAMDQNQQMTSNATNSLTESIITNLNVTNSTDSASQNVSNESERLKRGIDSIVIHTARNITNMNTTNNNTDVVTEHHSLAENSPIMSTSQSMLSEVEKQTEKACLIQGEECTNSTECCEHFECTMFDFIKWSKNCDFKPKDIQLTSPPPDVRIPKQLIPLQQAL